MQVLTWGEGKKKKNAHFQTTALLWRYSLPFLPSAHFRSLSSLPVCALPPPAPHSPCWIGGVNTGRVRALFHHTRAGAGRSCAAPVLGSKVYYGFHFTFPQPITEPHWCVWTLTPAKNPTQKMVEGQVHNCTISHLLYRSLSSFNCDRP